MNYTNIKKLVSHIWKTDFERKGLESKFTPVFYKIIGIENEKEYNGILSFLYKKASETKQVLFFANEIEIEANFDLTTNLQHELNNMDLDNLSNADIIIFDNLELNKLFLEALETTVKLFDTINSFMNKSSKIDYIIKLIIWMVKYVRPIEAYLMNSICPKCIYYGNIEIHEISFLVLLRLMNFDIIYMNPLKDNFQKIPKMDFIHEMIFPQIEPIGNIVDRINNSTELNLDISSTSQLMDEIQESMFTNTGVYRPWQFKDFEVNPIHKVMTIYDLKSNIAEPAKVRNGFGPVGNKINIPNLFFQIDGIFENEKEYAELVKFCCSQPYTIITTDGGRDLFSQTISDDDKLQLAFCRYAPKQYNLEGFKSFPFYSWDRYNESILKALISALNRVFSSGVIKKELDDIQEFNVVGKILEIDTKIIQLINSYDYSEQIPKIIVFLEYENIIYEGNLPILAFLYELGFDVIIFNPSGMASITSVINPNNFNYVRLDKMKYEATFDMYNRVKKRGFFSSLFGK